MPTIPYIKQPWTDGVSSYSAARAGVQEDGIFAAHYQPVVRVFHNANQSLTSGVDTVLAFNSERFDTASNAADTMHDNATNNSRLTCRYAGKYLINACVSFATNGTGYRLVKLRHSVGAAVIAVEVATPNATTETDLTISTIYDLAVNEYVEVVANQTSGGALNVNTAANYSPEFMMVRVA